MEEKPAESVALKDLDKFVRQLEKTELEAPEGVASVQTYAQLLAAYLHQNDLCNAKFLWKRIPASVKDDSAELSKIWRVGQRMWQRDWSEVHVALNIEWSDDVAHIMAGLKERVRERAMILIADAYSSLELTVLAWMTGLSLEEARQAALDRGWSIDTDGMVQPRKVEKEDTDLASKVCLTEDQLKKLTQFVSFLEN